MIPSVALKERQKDCVVWKLFKVAVFLRGSAVVCVKDKKQGRKDTALEGACVWKSAEDMCPFTQICCSLFVKTFSSLGFFDLGMGITIDFFPTLGIWPLFAHIYKRVEKISPGLSAQCCSVRPHMAPGPAALPIFVILNRTVTCSWDISMSFWGVSDSLNLGTSFDRGFSNLEKNRLKASGKSASSTPVVLVGCLVSLVCWLIAAIDFIPCQATLRSPPLY